MSAEALAAASQRAMIEALILISPILAAVLGVGILMSIIQAATRLNDHILSFVPRFFTVLFVTALAASWGGMRLFAYLQHSAALAAARF